MKQSKMLQVSGILIIIYAGILLLLSLILIFGGAAIASSSYDLAALGAGTGFAGGAVAFVGFLILPAGVFNLVMGILGVATWKKPEKSTRCFVFGIIAIVFNAIGLIIVTVSGSGFSSIVISLGLMALAILYTVGANKLKQGRQ